MQQEKIITSLEELPDLSKYKNIILDTETSGLSPFHGDRMCGICIGPLEEDLAYYIPVRHSNPSQNLPLPQVREWLNKLTHNPDVTIVGHNLKYDLTILRKDQIEVPYKIFDVMIAMHNIDSDMLNYGMDAITKRLCPQFSHTRYEQLKQYLEATQKRIATDEGKSDVNYSLVPLEILGPYGMEDVEATRLIRKEVGKQSFKPKEDNFGLPSRSQKELLFSDMEVVKTMFEMQWNGAPIDKPKAVQLRDKIKDEVGMLEDRLFNSAKFQFNPGAYTQMNKALESAGGRVLFWMKEKEERGKQKASHFTNIEKESTGRPCYNGIAIIKYLEKFKEENNQPAYEFMLNYRESQTRERVLSMFIDKIIHNTDAEGLLHAEINLHRAITGRLSVSNPSLQNQPRKSGSIDQKALESFLGTKDAEAIGKKIRSLFVAPEGYQLVSTDLSQIEYRAAAFFSRDEEILNRYRKDPTTDYHQATSDLIQIDRDLSKTINFMVLYGGGASGLAATLTGMGRATDEAGAKELLKRLYDARPMLKALIKEQTALAKVRGYVMNPLGRKIPVQEGFEYKALNYVIQSFCADLLRLAMVRIQNRIKAENLPVKMVLTIHDELQYLMRTEDVEKYAPLLAEELCVCNYMDIPLLSDIEVGQDWGSQIALKDWLEKRKAVA